MLPGERGDRTGTRAAAAEEPGDAVAARHITTAKFVDGTPLYRQEAQFSRRGISLGRATMAGWMLRLGGVYVVPITNLLHERMLSDPLIHVDETPQAGVEER